MDNRWVWGGLASVGLLAAAIWQFGSSARAEPEAGVGAATVRAPEVDTAADGVPGVLIPSPLLDAGTAPNASVTVPLRPPPAVRPSRESQLAEKLGLQPPKGKDAVVELLERFTAEELRLFAEIERRTHQPPSAAVVRWVERRKAGGSVAELKGQVDEVAAGDLLVRAALLRWLEPPQAQAPGLQPPGASGSGGPVPVRPLAPGRPGGQR